MKRRGPGRPALSAAERKGVILSVRLSREEREQVEAAARGLGLTAAAWSRQALLHASLVSSGLQHTES